MPAKQSGKIIFQTLALRSFRNKTLYACKHGSRIAKTFSNSFAVLQFLRALPVSQRRHAESFPALRARGGGGGGALPINGLMGMCRWMGSHFHDRTDYNGAAFSSIFYRVTRMGSHFCGILRVRKIWQVVIYKRKDSPKKNVTVFISVV